VTALHHLTQPRQVLHAVLVAPAGLRHETLGVLPRLTRAERRGPFADRAGVQHVVAEELERVAQPLVEVRQVWFDAAGPA